MDIQAIYLEMYKECCNQGRHHEAQRTSITTLSFGLAGAIMGYVTRSNGPKHEDLSLCIFLSVLGVLAAVVSYKQYERFELSMDRAAQYRTAIDHSHPSPPPPGRMIVALKRAGDSAHSSKYRVFMHVRLHIVWAALFLLIALIGAWLSWVAAWNS